jgi:hypothetical protein
MIPHIPWLRNCLTVVFKDSVEIEDVNLTIQTS